MGYISDSFEKELERIPHIVTEPQLIPVAGGILLACQKSGGETAGEMVDNLKKWQEQTEL